ncbi:4-hydroxybenzoate octaprenyltransferase [Micavibrio aeruginosavorus]|uniref:4-hydroxybenzoate octaprenyltransferase n=1 Tax=Micavibrio aeruginosavorus EPB TaxID=349215 RepID=M4VD04_9BACT|nr:4-hydroxybenzoate octaprenyltransferase [Micavibrio aeruginosavorus]AGH97093.1 4-hydroxybenzoate polyprenyltransferase [Micavibrio aeruginosavorus EPB]
MTHTDIRHQGWIAYLPGFVRPYALLMRLDRPIGTWLLLLPGWWAIVLAAGGVPAMNPYDWKLIALFAIGAIVMRGAGCVINDLWDRKLDAQVERTAVRPLASGAVSVPAACVLLGALLGIGLMILLELNITAILLGVLSVAFIVVYPAMKRITWWPQAFLGLTFNFGALMGWAAVTGAVDMAALYLYAAGFFWTLGYDTIYAHQDKEDDARIGIKSTALFLGEKSRIWIAGFYTLTLILLALAIGSVWGIVTLIPAAMHLAWQVKAWDMNDPASSLKFFRSNRDFGLLVLAAVGLATLL